MIIVFILSFLGIGLTVFYLLYRQVYAGMVKTKTQIIIHILVFISIYSIMILFGYLLSQALSPLMKFSAQWLSVALFFFLGMKMYRQVKKSKSQNWIFDTTKLSVLFLYCLSGAFDAFFAGIGLGFFSEYAPFYLILFSSGLLIFLLFALVMAKRQSATLSVWLFATFGASLLGLNTFVILIWLLFF